MTIHITPEQEFSYVSFESNVAASDYGDLITRVIETFQPGKFVVTILANKVRFHFVIISNLLKTNLPSLAELARLFGVPVFGAFRKDS